MRVLIRDVRESKKISIQKLAEASGISQAQLYRIENGESDTTLTTACKIAMALKVKPWDLFDCEDKWWDE